MAQRRNFPGRNLETDYSRLMGSFMDLINREHIKLARKLVRDANRRDNGVTQNAFRVLREKLYNSKLFTKVIDSLQSVFPRIEKQIVKEITSGYQRKGFPVPSLQLQADSSKLKQSITENVNLIKAIVDKHSKNLEKAVYEGIRTGSNFDIIIKEVEKQSNNGKAYAEFVARDQVAKAYADIAKEKQTNSGITKYEWVATEDDRTRPSHLELDEKIFSWDRPPMIDGRPLHPGEDYQCRCIALPVFD